MHQHTSYNSKFLPDEMAKIEVQYGWVLQVGKKKTGSTTNSWMNENQSLYVNFRLKTYIFGKIYRPCDNALNTLWQN